LGHERIGVLPRTRQWRSVVSDIANFPQDEDVATLAASTLNCVRQRYRRIQEDAGVRATFEFLIAVSAAGGAATLPAEWSDLPIVFGENPSPLRLAQALRKWVEPHPGSLEYRELAERAATDAVAEWHERHKEQGHLFGAADDAPNVWGGASSGGGFSELSRLFFSRFTERYLAYFLEREASAALGTVSERERFSERLHEHVEMVSLHAWETSKITQSFAAGWYNKNAKEKRPSDRIIKGFLSVAFGKIREELLRQGAER
jgi:hypothetical protein